MKMNRKDNRKKLIRTLFTVSRTRYDYHNGIKLFFEFGLVCYVACCRKLF